MNDDELIVLFEQRDEHAITETNRQYGMICRKIARELIGNAQDAEKICNDVWLIVWNSIPPEHPMHFFAYLAGITRKLAANRIRVNSAQRRGFGSKPAVLDELSECLRATDDVEQEFNRRMLTAAINDFLKSLPEQACDLFVLRYTFAMPVKEIAKRKKMTTVAVKVSLHRTRKKLREYLNEEGLL